MKARFATCTPNGADAAGAGHGRRFETEAAPQA